MLNKIISNRRFNRSTGQVVAIAICLLAALVRVVVFLQNRSLFLDEANLARNFVEKNYFDFFKPLSYEQYAPPLFSWMQKLNIQLLGVHEYALRLFPLLCSLVSIYVLYQLVKLQLKRTPLYLFVLWMFACSPWFVRYGTEVKQYSSDILLGILLPYLVLRERQLSLKWWVVIGLISPWLSMPAVFFLAGIGLYFLNKNARTAAGWRLTKGVKKWLGIIALWLINFGVYYYCVLRTNVNSNYLQDYHATYFLPLLPNSGADVLILRDLLLSIFKTGFGYTVPAYLVGIGGTLSGMYYALRGKISIASCLLLFVPILLCLFASALHFYSLIPRLTLFFIPALVVWAALGWEKLLDSSPSGIRWLVIGLLVLAASTQAAYQYLWKPYQIEEIKPALAYLKQVVQPTDWVYVHHHAVPATVFYTTQYTDNQLFITKDKKKSTPNGSPYSDEKVERSTQRLYLASWQDRPVEFIKNKPNERIWLLFSHVISASVNNEVNQLTNELKQKENFNLVKEYAGVRLYLYVNKPSTPLKE